jgi:hypothetical protein
MSNSAVEIVSVTAEIENLAGFGNVVDSVQVVEAVNQIPACYVSVHNKDSGNKAQKPLPKEFLSELANFQNTRLAGDETPTGRVTVKLEGQKISQEFTFEGYPVAPNVVVSPAVYNATLTLLHPLTDLNSLQSYIYGAVPLPHGLTGAADQKGEPLPTIAEYTTASGANFPKRFVQILKDRISSFEKNTGGKWYDPVTEGYVSAVHKRNLRILPILEEIGNASNEDSYARLAAILSRNDGPENILNITINSVISDYLSMAGEDFISIMLAMSDSVQSYFQPPSIADPSAPFGRIRPFRAMFEGADPEEKTVAASFLSLSEGSAATDPVVSVLVTGVPYKQTGQKLESAREHPYFIPYEQYHTFHVFSQNGEDTFKGKGMLAALPPWLPQRVMETELAHEKYEGADSRDIAAYEARKNSRAQTISDFYSDAFSVLLTEYARNTLSSVQLAPYVASIKTRLDFGWQVGKRYRVKVLKGDDDVVTVEGFLYKAVHDIAVSKQGSNGYTTLEFSYVKFQ